MLGLARDRRVGAGTGHRMTEVSHIGQLKPDGQNPRSHNPRNVGLIVDSLHKVGAARSIVIDEDNVILAGNGVIEAAAQAGIENVRVIEANGSEIIAVRRSGLTPEQKTALKYFDNQSSALASWDAAQIAADLEAGLDLSGMFYPEELTAILEQAADGIIGATDTDRGQQGVNSTWDQVKGAAADRVVIGEIETHIPQPVIDRVVGLLKNRYEIERTPVHETLERLLIAGAESFEDSGS